MPRLSRYTIERFNAEFPSEDTCLEWLRKQRFPELIDCPQCKEPKRFFRVKGRKMYQCDRCRYQLSPTAGTILHKSPTPLRSWFYALFLMASTRTGISAAQLQREIGVTYKTAWRMFSQIRKLMAEGNDPLGDGNGGSGVEVDETYVGGKRPGKPGRGAAGKTIVAGAVQRKGKIVAKVIPNVKAGTLIPFIDAHVLPASMVYTDELASYNKVKGRLGTGFRHKRVHHAAGVYVEGDAHTNTLEGFWSLVKRGIDGANHQVGSGHIQSYFDSYTYRWNHREDRKPMFTSLLERVAVVQDQEARGW
jgi:transposase-like protein